MPDAHRIREALQRAELVVVQDAYRTPATVAHADVLLPATTWAERDGTVTNSERRISRVRAAVPPFGQARHDWAIATDFARRLAARLPDAPRHLFPYETRSRSGTSIVTAPAAAISTSAGSAMRCSMRADRSNGRIH